MSEDKNQQGSSDPRFARIYNDPKFKKTKSKDLKIKLDDRFSKSDLEIRRKAKVDKYGRKLKETPSENRDLADFDKYFEKEEDEKKDDDDTTEVEKKLVDRARGDLPSDYVSSSDESSSDSESDESEDESEGESEIEIDEAKPESGDASKTLAVVNLDWDYVKASDLMITFSSFLPKGGRIEKISILPSEFGKERMQREEVEGPPRELFQKKKKKNSKKAKKSNDDEDDVSDVDIRDLYEEGDAEKDVDRKALRQYQLERLRYYYAVVYCNNVESAKAIYDNCDGTEYESTANMFDLRYVPDEMEFDDEPKDECDSLPKNYKPVSFSTDALQHSNVKLTWDETPADRVEVAKRAFTQKEIDDMDFKAYLASDSDESEDEVNDDVKNKLKALAGGSFASASRTNQQNGDDDDEGVDMEITFTPGLDGSKSEEKEEQEESTIEKVRRKEKERKKARKDKLKQMKQNSEQEKREKLKSLKSTKGKEQIDEKKRAELELLMMEDDDTKSSINSKAHFNMNEILRSEKEKNKRSKFQNKEKIVDDEFKPDLNDPRFNEIFEDRDFAIDPSQPEFKQTQAMKQILNERNKRSSSKSKKSKTNNNRKRKHDSTDKTTGEKNDIANIVNKLKKKSKK